MDGSHGWSTILTSGQCFHGCRLPREVGEEQAALGSAEAGSYFGRANPWQAGGQSWVEVIVRSGREEGVGAIKDLSDEISQFT